MADFVLWKVARRSGLQRIDGDELVAGACENEDRRAIGPTAQALEQRETLVARDGVPEQD